MSLEVTVDISTEAAQKLQEVYASFIKNEITEEEMQAKQREILGAEE